MRHFYIFNSILATLLFILVLGLEVDKGSYFRIVYLIYVSISWSISGACYNKSYKTILLSHNDIRGLIIKASVVTLGLECYVNLVMFISQCGLISRVYTTIAVAIIAGVSLLIVLSKKKDSFLQS